VRGEEPGDRPGARREAWWKSREAGLALAILALALGVGVFMPRFLDPVNLRDILVNAAVPATAAAGMTIVIVTAQIDISVGAALGVAAVAVALFAQRGVPAAVLFPIGIAAGALAGAGNGLLVAGLRIPSIVATLATMGAIRGLVAFFYGGVSLAVPEHLAGVERAPGIGPYFPVIVALIACTAAAFYLARTRAGRQHYAVGSNPRAAELSGVPVQRVTFRSFVLLGAFVGVAGFLYAAHFTPLSPGQVGRGLELEVITAVVVGGTDIFGGRGTVLGSALAAIFLREIETALTFFRSVVPGIPSEVQPAIQGLLILAAVLYNSLARRDA
jgi:ribose/xylose/arabinose/galactoside ABC-type transport system permease subunit